MYEDQTESVVENRMLSRVSNSVDKRQGSIIYDATMSTAVEVMLLYAVADFILKNSFGDTADREYLVERAKERGLAPDAATYAYVQIESHPEDCVLPIGSRYSVDELNYVVTKRLTADGNTYMARCETAGTVGNKTNGKAIPIDHVTGLQYAEITAVLVPGEDEEDTEVFRQRYLKTYETQAYGGNITDYQEKVGKIDGVGGVKVYPIWNGGGTVKVVFSTSENKVPSSEFVSEVQEALDPIPYAQHGVGIAPIGHRVTVQGVAESSVSIGLNINFLGTDTYDTCADDIKATIQSYFDELNADWQATEVVTTSRYENRGLVIRISQLESRLLARPYVSDIGHTTLNGSESNLELADDALATVGTVTYNGGLE